MVIGGGEDVGMGGDDHGVGLPPPPPHVLHLHHLLVHHVLSFLCSVPGHDLDIYN